MPDDGDQTTPSDSPTARRSPVRQFALPKRGSSSNLLDQPTLTKYSSAPSRSGSLDQSTNTEPLTRQRSVIHEHESSHGIAPSGLHRIRQQPQRNRSTPSLLTRSTSMTNDLPSPGIATQPSSPHLTSSEDLIRFPTESLHSFSFAEKSNDFLQMRHNVLKRSMDLLNDRGMWASGGLGTANAQAKVSGDQEVQSMMELLDKAKMLGHDRLGQNGLRLAMAPMTGPAHIAGDNVFEKSFMGCSESPDPISPSEPRPQVEAAEAGSIKTPSLVVDAADEPARSPHVSSGLPPGPYGTRPRATLKRTYTDIGSLSLQNQLADALTQPYVADDSLSSPSAVGANDNPLVVTSFPGFMPHAHGRNTPMSQAIFTTDAIPPWTISAANDLACLAFGVQKSEIRKLSILDVVREDKRKWLESKLGAGTGKVGPRAAQSMSPPRTSVMGGGLTARLLAKPPSRETGQGRRAPKGHALKRSNSANSRDSPRAVEQGPSTKGVLLCGDVFPIQKRNGDTGSATLWVQEKNSKLIWVMEEISEDVAHLSIDEIGCVTKVTGKIEPIWGMEYVRRGMDVTRLIPNMPRLKGTNTGAIDYTRIAQLRGFTARTANDISIPVTVDQLAGQPTFRISSFPHVAGMMIVSASSLRISSCNSVVSEALFGRSTNDLLMSELIPGFDKMLELLVEDDQIEMIEGMVIPEHSFRRARAILALREGKGDAAALFLRPNGLPALHRDGAQIMVDVQMRVVKGDAFSSTDANVAGDQQHGETSPLSPTSTSSGFVYAIWVTYSRHLHAEHHGIGPVSPLISRPGTPPSQPQPTHQIVIHSDSESDDSRISSARDSGAALTPPMSTDPKLHRTMTQAKPAAIIPPGVSKDHRSSWSINDFTVLEDMGAGAYGQVKLARPKTSAPFALRQYPKVVIKYVTKRRILVDTWMRDRKLGTVPLEIHVLNYLKKDGLQHPNIIEMIDFFEDDVNYYIIMKPHGLPGMDLFDYIELRVNMEEEECRRMFSQIVSAVHFLHTVAKVVHRDIKDENVILDGNGNIKLIDFGSASYIKSGPFDVFVGTIDYAAPEVLTDTLYDGLAQDIWALGILLYTILYKENPFYSIDEIMDRDLRVPYIVSEESIALVRWMLDRDVTKRPNIEQVANHPWLVAQ